MRHRTAVVTAASIAGVVLAGATALGANLGILSSAGNAGDLSAIAAATSPSSSTTIGSTSETIAYQVQGVGVVSLTRAGERLALAGVQAGAGWTWTVEEEGDEVSITFRNGDRKIEFKAQVEGGSVAVQVEEEQVIVDSTTSTSIGDHDDGDDDGDEDDHEDGDDDEDDDGHDDDD